MHSESVGERCSGSLNRGSRSAAMRCELAAVDREPKEYQFGLRRFEGNRGRSWVGGLGLDRVETKTERLAMSDEQEEGCLEPPMEEGQKEEGAEYYRDEEERVGDGAVADCARSAFAAAAMLAAGGSCAAG